MVDQKNIWKMYVRLLGESKNVIMRVQTLYFLQSISDWFLRGWAK